MRNASLLAVILLLTGSFLKPLGSSPEARTLSIAGQPGYAKIFEVDGKAYVEIEDVARLTKGSLSFDTNRILLTLPTGPVHAATAAAPATQGFSREFLQSGIEQMSVIREWRITIVTSIRNNSPVSEEWVSELQRRAQKNLALLGTARSTGDDRNAYLLLAAEFANMRKLSDDFMSKRRRMQYIDPDSIDNDPLDRQIVACARGLASMAADNQFHDEAACTEVH